MPKSDKEIATAVAAVLSNWHNVLRAINMASSRRPQIDLSDYNCTDVWLVKFPKPSRAEDEGKSGDKSEIPLPQTLVRIPIESPSEVSQSQNGTGKSSEE